MLLYRAINRISYFQKPVIVWVEQIIIGFFVLKYSGLNAANIYPDKINSKN
jgi:hypothetical protein